MHREGRGFKSRRPDHFLKMVEDKVASRTVAVSQVNQKQHTAAYVYVLRSVNDGWYYVGCSVDPRRRLIEHNSGESKATRARRPYELAYTEQFPNLSAARKREQEIKRKKSRQYIDWLITGRTERK